MPDVARANLTPNHPMPLKVIADLPCRRCGYALRGCGTDGRCPECGLAVEESIRSAIDLASLEAAESDFAPTRRATWSIPALAVAAAIGTAAGLALPLAVVLAPPRFDPRGFGNGAKAVRAVLDPALAAAGTTTAVAAVLAIVVTLISRWRRHARREAFVSTLGGMLMLSAAGVLLLPGGLGLPAAADVSARGLGALLRGGGQAPAPVVLVALAFDALRALGIAFIVSALGDLLHRIGRRSASYALAGQGLQGARPVVAATLATLLMSTGWLMATVTDGLDGPVAAALDSIAWPILWLVAAGLTVLGGGYLAVNAIWATAPWRRRQQRLDELVGPATTSTEAATMADPPGADRAP
jgi:hypothetical protein